MRRYSSKNRKGFTLGEMLITVAVVAILSAVAIISVVGYLWNVRLLDADQAAREVYLAAQYHLSLARERGMLDQYKDDLGTVDQLYKGSDYVNQDGGTLYDLVYSPGNNAADVINAILPQGSIDETMRTGGSYIITYDKDTATVIGVFYSYAGRNYGYSFTADTLTKEADALQDAMKDRDSSAAKAVRKHFPDTKARKTIGFYGGKDLAAAGKSDAPLLRIENGDTLNAIVTLSKEQNDLFSQPQRDHAVQLTIKGQTSGNTVTKVFDASTNKADVTTSGNGLYQYAVVLDAWQDQNGDDKKQIDWQFKDTAKPLIPGENITVTASIVKKNNDGSYSSASKPSNSVLTNSMFGSLKTVNGQYTVTISSIRHLENLSKISEDSAKQLNIANAKQVTDISFTAYQKNMASFFNSDKPEMYSYLPVPLKNELTYDAGYLDGDNARQYMLSDIDAVGGGVFDTLAKDKKLTVSNLQIVDINVKSTGSAYAGALLSEAGENSTVNTNNVLVWDKSATIGISAETDAGGLIGHSDGNVIIKNTAVSAYVKSTGGNAGGLIGSASSLSVSSSYVSAHTYQGDFVTDVNPQTDKHSQHYNIIAGQGNAGGIVGSVSSLYKLTNSYVTASIYGKTANAFAGAVSDNDAYTKNKCYAVSVINGRKVKEPSTFSGIADRSTKYVNDESLLAGNDEVIYPFTVISTNDVNAKAWFLKTHVGDWTMPREDEKPSVSFNNDEILQLIASVPNAGPDDEVEIQFFYQGVYGLANLSSAHAYKTFVFNEDKVTKEWKITVKDKDGKVQNDSDWMSDLCKAETIGNVTTFTINIDDITYYKNGHHGNFTNVISQGSGHPAGYDVTARVMVNGTTVSDPVYTNSLYGDNTNKDNTVISCARHLQNVSHEVSDWRTDIFSMNLTSDIFWNTPSNSFFDRVKKLRISQDDVVDGVYTKDGKLIADKKFLSIDGSTYFDNNRKNSGFEGNGHTISDISFEKENGLAGLFGYIGINGFQISNLTIQNGKIQESGGVTSAGLFAGSFQNGIISHCFVTGVDSQVRIGTSGDAGGLAGYLQNTTVSDCGASAYVQGGNAGGLVGNFNSGTITASFSGGRTTNGSYLSDAKRTGYFNVEGYVTAGGLVGDCLGKVSNSYSSSSVFGGEKSDEQKDQWGYTTGSVKVGGLIGATTMSESGAINNCYAVGMVQGPKGSTGALVSTYGDWQNDMMQNNYYLEGINFDSDTLEELPAASCLTSGKNYDDNFKAVDYYSLNNPIDKPNDSVIYITYSYDDGLKGDYPFISYTRQSDNSNISVHYGGWQIPVDKIQYRWVKLYDENHTTMLASKAVLRGSSFDISKIKPTNPDGKTFVGWIDANGNVLSVADFTSISKDITAYAKYSRQMTFKYVNPETGKDAGRVANVDFNTDDSVTVPKAPVISGYAFDGWYTKIDGGEKAVVVDGKISNPAIKTNIYYARYRQIRTYTYTMIFCYEKDDDKPVEEISSLNRIVYQRTSDNYSTFSQVVDLSNKTVANATVDKLVVVKNDDPKEVIRTDDNVNQKSTVTMTGDAFNKTYYVMYKAQTVTYTVEHIFHDSTTTLDDRTISDHNFAFKDGNGNDKLVYSKGNTVTLTETLTGYVGSKTRASLLDLSSVKDEFEVTSTFEQKNLKDAKRNVTITIDYYRKKYTLEYSAPDANNYIPPVSIDYGAPVTLANKDQVVRPGYTLTDWTISYNDAEQSRGFEIASMPAADVTAAANWTVNKTAKVTVQFWQQKPHKKESYTTADYDYYGAYTVDAAIGSKYPVDHDNALKLLAKRNPSDFDHFKCNEGLSATEVTVAADGSNTINLYYDRDVITINFYKYSWDWRYLEWHLDEIVPRTGLYGEEFDEDQWDNRYDWYDSFDRFFGPSGTRLTFITYFHAEDDAGADSSTMTLYGKPAKGGYYTVSHYLEKLNGNGRHDETGYDLKNYTLTSGDIPFTLSNKYPNGYNLEGYSIYSRNLNDRFFTPASAGEPVYYGRNNLAVFYKRKNITITLSNAVINNVQSGVDYQFTEKYGTSYKTIASELQKLEVSKPVNAQGEEFVGWYLDSGCTQPFTGDDETLDGPLQLFAKWENCKYHVNFYYGNEKDTAPLKTVDVSSGDVLSGEFPDLSADEGYEVRWYYRDSADNEHQYVKDRQIQLDLVSKKEKDSAGYYTINLYARKVAVNPVHLYYELYDQDAAQVITYQGSGKLETEETYSVGAAFTITPPDLDGYGYTFVFGNTGVASSNTQENPIRLVYAEKQDSWRHIVETYARYADIDDSGRTAVSEKLSSRTALNDSAVQYAVDTAPELDGYTFVQSALLADENDTSYAVSDDSQITVNKPDSKDQSQVVRFWYTPSFDGTLQNSSAVYDGKEHSVSYQLNSVPAVGSNNTLVYKYTYSLNNASTATTYVQYAWTNADGTTGTYGHAPVNAGVYSVQVEILLFKAGSVNTSELDRGENLLTVYRNASAGSLTISPAELVITSGSQSWLYGTNGTGFHTNTDWSATVNGAAVDQKELHVTVSFLDTSKIQQPGTMANEFTVSFTDAGAANNYAVTKVYGSLHVDWQYRVKYVLSLPDVVYEAKSDAEKADAVRNDTDVKPVEIVMQQFVVTSENPNVFDAAKADDSKPAALDGLKLTNGDAVQNVGYHNGDQTVTYVYTPDFDGVSIVKDDALGVYEMKLADNAEKLKKVLSALKPYLADQTPHSADDTPAPDASDYQKYLGTKNPDYRLVYEMTYTQQNSAGTAGASSTVVYLAGEDGTVKDKDGKAAVLSGSVPASGTYVVSGRIVLQHRSDVLDKDGRKTGDQWSDANIVYVSSDTQNVTVTLK
ncbi:InlB B-repeat-containing protein [Stecheria sp. CLA-KB-P133]|uniref:InlB B-repeat-containing protein n=1 Tax=Grylomicrobium aquisgranensis TaxID=2926318 RepID=A0AB35U5A4_9FIRM|nr:InlB B-repeat-containing protein [Stecheria sp. CLA-KB-P133]